MNITKGIRIYVSVRKAWKRNDCCAEGERKLFDGGSDHGGEAPMRNKDWNREFFFLRTRRPAVIRQKAEIMTLRPSIRTFGSVLESERLEKRAKVDKSRFHTISRPEWRDWR